MQKYVETENKKAPVGHKLRIQGMSESPDYYMFGIYDSGIYLGRVYKKDGKVDNMKIIDIVSDYGDKWNEIVKKIDISEFEKSQ